MQNYLTSLFNGRWRPLIILASVYLLLSFVFRLGLAIYSWDQLLEPIQLVPGLVIGLIYDFAFISYFALAVILFSCLIPRRIINHRYFTFVRLVVLVVALFGLFFLFFAESFFWEEFTARFNFVSVDYLVYSREVTNNIYQSYPVVIILEFCFVAALVLLLLLRKGVTVIAQCHQSLKERAKVALAFILLPVVMLIFLDQDLRNFSSSRVINEISSNGPYQFFAAFRSSKLDFDAFYATLSDIEAADRFRVALDLPQNSQDFSPLRRIVSKKAEKQHNVMFVAIESLSADYMEAFGNNRNLTPNLDALKQDSLFFNNLYATGSRTTRGLEALSLSIPPSPGRSVVKRPEQVSRYNIATEFQNRNYDTVFFYGGRGYFDNMNAFFAANGLRVIDQTDFNESEKGFENAWGVADEFLFNRVLREADDKYAQKTPFFYFLLTTSNHRPYSFPEGRIDLPIGTREAAVKYTDWAIGDFLTQAKQKPWFDNTVFVFVADHCSGSAGKTNLSVRKHHVPMLIYSPANIQPREVDNIISQIDVAPTLLGLMDFSYDSLFIGEDVLAEGAKVNRAFIANYQYLGLFQDDQLVYMKPKKLLVKDAKPFEGGGEVELGLDDNSARQLISWYQSAERIEEYKMSRVDGKNSTVELSKK